MTKFNTTICDELLKARAEGLPQTACAKIVGISRETLRLWLKNGANAKTGKKKEFYDRWQIASAKFELYHLKKISDNKDWRASQYLLQVTRPEDYVVINKTENKNTNTHTFEDLFDDEEIRRQSNELKNQDE